MHTHTHTHARTHTQALMPQVITLHESIEAFHDNGESRRVRDSDSSREGERCGETQGEQSAREERRGRGRGERSCSANLYCELAHKHARAHAHAHAHPAFLAQNNTQPATTLAPSNRKKR